MTNAHSPNTRASQTDTTIVDRTRDSAAHAVDVTREGARDAARNAAAAIEANPMVALAGGIALGAAIGALLPKTSVEREHLAPIGRKLTETAATAVRAAREVGKDELSALTPDRDTAKAKAQSILKSVASAAKDSTKIAS